MLLIKTMYRSSRRKILGAFALSALVATVVIGLCQKPEEEHLAGLPREEMQAALAGSPPSLAALHRQGGELLPGGYVALQRRLRALRGRPAVVNLWASWCPPCRAEALLLQRVATEYGKRVAFIGVDSNDNAEAARQLLRSVPVPYPSYVDRPQRTAQSLRLRGLPGTTYYDSSGHRVYIHQGQYVSLADLRRDLHRIL
jgi:thiol-disulfide isomerase/thioredoxin